MPPSASENAPSRDATAPVKAPRSWPKNSLPARLGTTVVQSNVTNGPLVRSPIEIVDQVRGELLPGTALAGEQDVAAGIACDLDDVAERSPPRRAAADEGDADPVGLELSVDLGPALQARRDLLRGGVRVPPAEHVRRSGGDEAPGVTVVHVAARGRHRHQPLVGPRGEA